jgi:hypothetical protein
VRVILLAGEEPDKWPPLVGYVVPDGSPENRVRRFERVENRAQRCPTIDVHGNFAANLRQRL